MENDKNKHIHPITRIIQDMTTIFLDMGFEIESGPEIEDEYHNFDALNVPKDHPARDMQDTFWLRTDSESRCEKKEKTLSGQDPQILVKKSKNFVNIFQYIFSIFKFFPSKFESPISKRDFESVLKPKNLKRLLRTHTSPVQIRYTEKNKPPFAIVVPGKVFRNEATDATHDAQFHQVEGLVVGENITLANLKGTLEVFLQKIFGEGIKIRLRPGYFPFVEPGVEIDMVCFKCKGEGCSSCSHNGWIEILGAGMVHPNVLNNVGIDSRKYQGFAFGIGVDRIAMLKYGIDDIRLFYSGDLRLVNQF